jgi:anti-sigma B factor antagonist
MLNEKPVIVKELPTRLVAGVAHLFCHKIESALKSDRPRLVFDFAKVREIDSRGIGMLLHCAEEVMKRNGNLKFASVGSEAGVMLELTGVESLFEIYDNVPDAIESFSPCSVSGFSPSWFTATEASDENTGSDVEIAA